MKVVIATGTLLSYLTKCNVVAPSKSIIPIIQGTKMQVIDNKIVFTATDLENSIVLECTEFESEYALDFNIALDHKSLIEILKTLPEQPIELKFDREKMMLTASTIFSEYSLAVNSGLDFPKVDVNCNNCNEAVLKSQDMLNIVNVNGIYASTDDFKPNMSGVFFDIKADTVSKFVATDAHRLCVTSYKVEASQDFSFIYPNKALKFVKSVITRGIEQITILYDGKQIIVKVGDVTLVSRTCEGKFPPYEAVIPKFNEYGHLHFESAKELASVIKRAAVCARKSTGMGVLSFENGILKVQSEDSESAKKAVEKINCSAVGEVTSDFVGLDLNMTSEILAGFDKDIQMYIKSKATAVVLRSTSSINDILVLQMPVMIGATYGN